MNFPSTTELLDFLSSPEARESAEKYQANIDRLRSKSKDAQLAQAAERVKPAAVCPERGVSVTMSAEPCPSHVAFEAWAQARGVNIDKIHLGKEYQSKSTRELWWCWQASREALGATLARQRGA
ncbi:hypothetical protein FBY06_11558 [Pseudomonas sp. SJZ085]|uniref:hypothetical protein n=1 Tax=unclassified Pseudomonas TaxID=196821 RepID=UPI00119C1786|nr:MULTISPECIES: hypothetical protein [unclassified Pseudomonas]TWC18133.1 hypothetical protein FBX99_11558 [Pseudomonas sp. SJZ074]TWC36105.1 hypothetical protein FBY06_11558 [Pseudomonas sp. SJZ085]